MRSSALESRSVSTSLTHNMPGTRSHFSLRCIKVGQVNAIRDCLQSGARTGELNTDFLYIDLDYSNTSVGTG